MDTRSLDISSYCIFTGVLSIVRALRQMRETVFRRMTQPTLNAGFHVLGFRGLGINVLPETKMEPHPKRGPWKDYRSFVSFMLVQGTVHNAFEPYTSIPENKSQKPT